MGYLYLFLPHGLTNEYVISILFLVLQANTCLSANNNDFNEILSINAISETMTTLPVNSKGSCMI